ncbi:hypothetical protein LXL04_004154 [Taraxacum kok-saghyz]
MLRQPDRTSQCRRGGERLAATVFWCMKDIAGTAAFVPTLRTNITQHNLVNSCSHTIWPQLNSVENNKPIDAFELPSWNTQYVETLVDFYGYLYNWNDYQINNTSSCKNINGPVTMVVFKLQVNATDEYYVDNMDGFNLPVSVDAIGGSGSDYIVRYCPAARTFSTIQVGEWLQCINRLTSRNGTFTLGFYGVNFGSLSIWCSNDENNKLWVTDPTLSTSGNHFLAINPNIGSLIIIVGSSTLRVITDVKNGPSLNLMVTLREDGRLHLIANTTVLKSSYMGSASGCCCCLCFSSSSSDYSLLLLLMRYFVIINGTFGSGEETAVKKLEQTSCQGRPQFDAEIKAIVNAKHICTVQVRGCCIHGYEEMRRRWTGKPGRGSF